MAANTSLNLLLKQWSSDVTALAVSHLAYPILHFYYNPGLQNSLPVALAVLDEALSMIHFAVPQKHWPDALLLNNTRNSVFVMLQTVENTFVKKRNSTPPLPTFNEKKPFNFPLSHNFQLHFNKKEMVYRRKVLAGLLNDEGKNWQIVYNEAENS